jgi:hypothetical protein
MPLSEVWPFFVTAMLLVIVTLGYQQKNYELILSLDRRDKMDVSLAKYPVNKVVPSDERSEGILWSSCEVMKPPCASDLA